jgi:hypothetical protein
VEAEWLGDEMSQAAEMNTFTIHLRPSVILTNLLPYTITINTPVSDDADFDLPVLCGVISRFVLMLSVKHRHKDFVFSLHFSSVLRACNVYQ